MGLDRSTLLRELGVNVVSLPFEIHPEIPVGGLSLADRWGDRYGEALETYERIEAECDAAGLDYRRPQRVPNTRRALKTAEWAAGGLPRRSRRWTARCSSPISSTTVRWTTPRWWTSWSPAGADPVEARRAVEAGEMKEPVDVAMAVGARIGVRGTPAWLLERRLLIPGCLPRDVFRSAVERVKASPGAPA